MSLKYESNTICAHMWVCVHVLTLTTVNSKHRTSSLIYTSGLRQPRHTLTFIHTCAYACAHNPNTWPLANTLYSMSIFIHSLLHFSPELLTTVYFEQVFYSPIFTSHVFSKFSTLNIFEILFKLFPLYTPLSCPALLLHSPLHSILSSQLCIWSSFHPTYGCRWWRWGRRGVMRKAKEAGICFPGGNGTNGCLTKEGEYKRVLFYRLRAVPLCCRSNNHISCHPFSLPLSFSLFLSPSLSGSTSHLTQPYHHFSFLCLLSFVLSFSSFPLVPLFHTHASSY